MATTIRSGISSSASRTGPRPKVTFADGVVVNRVMDAAYASAKSGTWQPIGR